MAPVGYLAWGILHILDLRHVLLPLEEKSRFFHFSSKSMIGGVETEWHLSIYRAHWAQSGSVPCGPVGAVFTEKDGKIDFSVSKFGWKRDIFVSSALPLGVPQGAPIDIIIPHWGACDSMVVQRLRVLSCAIRQSAGWNFQSVSNSTQTHRRGPVNISFVCTRLPY